MHEYSITTSLIQIIEKIVKEKKIKKVEKVNLEINPLASIEPDSIKFYFEFLTKENPELKDAEINFKKVKIKVKCSNCDFIFYLEDLMDKCPNCGSYCFDKSLYIDIEDIKIVSLEAVT